MPSIILILIVVVWINDNYSDPWINDNYSDPWINDNYSDL